MQLVWDYFLILMSKAHRCRLLWFVYALMWKAAGTTALKKQWLAVSAVFWDWLLSSASHVQKSFDYIRCSQLVLLGHCQEQQLRTMLQPFYCTSSSGFEALSEELQQRFYFFFHWNCHLSLQNQRKKQKMKTKKTTGFDW